MALPRRTRLVHGTLPGGARKVADMSTASDSHTGVRPTWFNTYYPYYGDVAHLDSDSDGDACEGLS